MPQKMAIKTFIITPKHNNTCEVVIKDSCFVLYENISVECMKAFLMSMVPIWTPRHCWRFLCRQQLNMDGCRSRDEIDDYRLFRLLFFLLPFMSIGYSPSKNCLISPVGMESLVHSHRGKNPNISDQIYIINLCITILYTDNYICVEYYVCR